MDTENLENWWSWGFEDFAKKTGDFQTRCAMVRRDSPVAQFSHWTSDWSWKHLENIGLLCGFVWKYLAKSIDESPLPLVKWTLFGGYDPMPCACRPKLQPNWMGFEVDFGVVKHAIIPETIGNHRKMGIELRKKCDLVGFIADCW